MLRTRMWAAVAAAGAATGVGCDGLPKKAATTTTSRSQAADDLADKQANASVGDKTALSNTEPVLVSAVGLVWNLRGTGATASGEWRPLLERSLRKQKFESPKQLLDDPNRTTAMVLVSAAVPPGARKGDPVDVDVCLPRGSGCTSLKGGTLFDCELVTSEQSAAVRETMIRAGVDVGAYPVAGNTLLLGKGMVRAEGPLVAGTRADKPAAPATPDPDAPPEPTGYTVARIWGGGRVTEDRKYWFTLNDDEKSARLAMEIAARLNATFQLSADGRAKVANAVSKEVVEVAVPPAYRLNHNRFLMVARQVPLLPVGPDSLARKKLEQELLEPETAIRAAVKLEALGGESQQPLRRGLESQSPWVRYAAAEALAYLGSTAGVGELARLAEQHPALRTHCLLALASLDDGVSADRLAELMSHPDPALRYGAFVALWSSNDRHPAAAGKHVRKAFWLHQVAPNTRPLVHLNGSRRAEVVLFGGPGQLVPPFSFPVGTDFVVSAGATDELVKVTHIVPGADGAQEATRQVKPTLAAVLNAVGELGGGYSEAVEVVRKADTAKVLAAAVTRDAAPRGLPLTELAKLSRTDTTLETSNLEVARAAQGGDVLPAGYDLPTEAEAVQVTPASATEPALNRNPGRLFGPKKHPLDAAADGK